MKMLKLVFLVVFCVSLSACYDGDEPNDIVYTVALGLDKAETEGDYEITIQFAKPAQISGGGEGTTTEGSSTTDFITVNAPSIYAGINIANHMISKRFTLSHTKLIVFSEEIAREGMLSTADTMARSSEIRPNIYICIAKGSANEYLKSIKPVVEINPEKYYQLIFENEYSNFTPKCLSHHFYFKIRSDEICNLVPLAGVEQKDKQKQEKSESGSSGESGGESSGDSKSSSSGGDEQSQGESKKESEEELKKKEKKIPINELGFEYKIKEYIAGNIDVEKKNQAEVSGAAVFRQDKMIGEITQIEGELYNILSGEYQFNYVSYYSEKSENEPITLMIEQSKKPNVSVKINGTNPKIKINLYLKGNFVSISPTNFLENDTESYSHEISEYTKQAAEKFLYKTSREFGADIIGFGGYAHSNFRTYDDFENYNWLEKYKEAEFEVNVDIKLEGAGLIARSNN